MQHVNNIPWGDAETTGLMNDPATVPLEFAFVVTDGDLNELDSIGPFVFSATEEELASMGDFVRNMHTKTGLLEKVRASTLKREDADDLFAGFLSKYLPAKGTPLETVSLNEPKGEYRGGQLAGNSVKLDIAVLEKFFPKTYTLLDYRVIDVSTISELAKRWNPKAWASMPPKASDHTAMTDIRASIDELRYYRSNGFNGIA